MATTQSAQDALRPRPISAPDEPEIVPEPRVETPARERDARDEIDRLRVEIERLVRVEGDARARDAVDSALETMARLQVVTANADACFPPSGEFVGSALIALADARLSGHADAIERGMTYTSDNQMRLLQNP